MAREYRRMLSGVAKNQERGIAGMDGKDGMPGVWPGAGNVFDARRDLLARRNGVTCLAMPERCAAG